MFLINKFSQVQYKVELKMKTIMDNDLYIKKNLIFLKFTGNRGVISTSLLNGGTRGDLKFVFNFDGKGEFTDHYIIEEKTYLGHLRNVAIKFGLNPSLTTGLSTSADIKNFGLSIKHKNETCVMAIITAGVGGNAGRAGDPCSFDEMYLEGPLRDHGTINIILEINVNLSKGALTNALITVTEAKSALLQELQIGSLYSNQIATGTGTDGCIIICNRDSNYLLTNTGKHSLLGELISDAVKDALRKALFKQDKITPQRRFDFFKLATRYGISEKEVINELMKSSFYKNYSNTKIQKRIEVTKKDGKIIIPMILIIHLLDQINWRILKVRNTLPIILRLIDYMLNGLNLKISTKISIKRKSNLSKQIFEVIKDIYINSIKKCLK
jgi:adenosylcobinamide amidohydrolase